MRINRITQYQTIKSMPQQSFGRQLRDDEKQDYQKNAIEPALKYLGVENMAMILHGSCNPVAKNDLGVGSPNGEEAEKMIEFEKLHGFNSNQLGPMGEVTRGDISPYSASVFAINRLFIDVNLLTKDEYANIFPREYVKALSVSYPQSSRMIEYSHFFDAFENNDKIIKEAYKNFKARLRENNPNAKKLNEEYNAFKAKKGNILTKSAIFEVLSKTYGTRDFDVWESDIDRNLIQLLNEGNETALKRYKQLQLRSKEDINAYVFAQFLENKQLKDNKEFRDKVGFEYINDNLIGNDKSEEWMYNGVFLKDYRIGCPHGGANDGPQLWDIPMPDPKKLFNPDGSLGPSGQFIKNKIESELEYCENLRIDHALGLVDPFVYDKNSVSIHNGQYNFDNFVGKNISNMPELDPQGDYKRVLKEIVLPILREHNISPNEVVWEDIGDQTETFKNIYSKELNLPGMTQLHWDRGEGASRENWMLMGSHDEPSAISYVKEDFAQKNFDTPGSAWHVDYLSGFLNADPTRAKEREEMKQILLYNPYERVKAKFAELLLCGKRVQIPFSDFFGIEERYNLKGQKSALNWKLRLGADYQDEYYKNLESKNPTAINMPEILKMAVQAKMDLEVVNYGKQHATFKDQSQDLQKIEDFRENLEEKMMPLMNKLGHYENVLKEKS